MSLPASTLEYYSGFTEYEWQKVPVFRNLDLSEAI